MSSERIIKALGVTAEAMGQQISAAGLLLMADDLAPYGEESVLAALSLVRRECRRLTVADVVDRMQSADGRPGADEAWATAMLAIDESETVVWTQEASQAFEVARPLMEINDKTGARMAFRDAYERITRENRANGTKARWFASLGWDTERRTTVLTAAVEAGRLCESYARGLLPPPAPSAERNNTLLALVSSNGILTNEAASAIERENARKRIAEIKAMLSGEQKGAA